MPIKLEVLCDDEAHRIDIEDDGQMVVYDHDVDSTIALIALGLEPPRCFKYLQMWEEDPVTVLMEYTRAQFRDPPAESYPFLFDQWNPILLEWIMPFEEVVLEQLKGYRYLAVTQPHRSKLSIKIFGQLMDDLRGLVAIGPGYYYDDSENRARLGRMFDKTINRQAAQMTYSAPTAQHVFYAIRYAMDYALTEAFSREEEEMLIRADSATLVLEECVKAAWSSALFDLRDEQDEAPVEELLWLKGQEERVTDEAADKERLECIQTAIKHLEVPGSVTLL